MLRISHFGFLAFLLGTDQIVVAEPPSTLLQDTKEVSGLSDSIMDSIFNPQLQKTLQAMVKGQLHDTISKQEATKLLLAAMDETYHALDIVTFLIGYFQHKRQPWDSHQVMVKALDLAPVEVVAYLLEKGMYNKDYLDKEQHDNFLSKLDGLHIAYILFIDSVYIKLIPHFITTLWGIISFTKSIIWLLSWFSTSCDNLLQWIDSYIGGLFFLKFKWYLAFYLLRVLIALYMSIMVSIKPGYLFYLFTGDFERKSKKEVEEKALLLLKYGARPAAKAFFVQKQAIGLPLPEELNLYSYSTLSILHLATQYDMLSLVQDLIKRGATINAVATFIRDTFNYPTEPGQIGRSLPFQLVTARDLYNGEKSIKRTPLDLAPGGSNTYQYLKEHGGKYYEAIKPSEKRKQVKKVKTKSTYKK